MGIPSIDSYSPITRVLFNHVRVTDDGCWEWAGTRRKGYGRLSIAGRNYSIHRLIYEDVVGPIPAGQIVMHRCDNPPCCRPDHLKAGTQAENLADMRKKGRANRAPAEPKPIRAPRLPAKKKEPVGQALGSRHGNSKLSEDAVREIRTSVEAGVSQADLARKYGVHQSQISRALNGKLWAHV